MIWFHIMTRGEYCNRNTPNPQYILPVGSKVTFVVVLTAQVDDLGHTGDEQVVELEVL